MDSALARDGQPWFVPDFGHDWSWVPALAVRVSRLGKCVSTRFASRYYDAMTLLFLPRCSDPRWQQWQHCMDGAAVVGRWTDLTDRPEIDGRECGLTLARFDTLVAEASKVMTLRTGDVLAIPLYGIMDERKAEINTRVQLSLNGCQALGFNIK